MTKHPTSLSRRSEVEDAALTIVTPAAYEKPRCVEEAFRLLRERQPFYLIESPHFESFYAVTRHADVFDISRRHREFLNGPRTLFQSPEADQRRRLGQQVARPLVEMDGPVHYSHRSLLTRCFDRQSLERLQPLITRIAGQAMDRMAEIGPECDLVTEVASPYTLQVLTAVLGEPPSSFTHLTAFVTGKFEAHIGDMVRYLSTLIADRCLYESDDLVSAVARGTVEGDRLPAAQQISHLLTVITAGYETTVATLAASVAALLGHPDEWRKVRADPALMASAVEEMVRWASPVRGFMRTAAAHCEVGGQKFEAGDALLLCYPSANRDENVFKDPYKFDVGRKPNRHLGFGTGVHHCLGAGLARAALRCFLTELSARLQSAEIVGKPTYSRSLFIGGMTHLRLRYELRGHPC